MAAKRWMIWLALGVFALVVLGGLAGGAAWFYIQYTQGQFLKKGEEAYASAQWPVARRNYASYLNRHPSDTAILAKYADACSRIPDDRERMLTDASKAYVRLSQERPNDLEIQRKLLRVKELLGAWNEVEYYADFFARSRPEDPELLNLRAKALDRMGRRDDAIDAYQALVAKGIAEPRVYGALALLLQDRGLKTQAQDVIREASEKNQGNGEVLACLARYYAAFHEMDKAQATLAKAQALAPDHVEVLRTSLQIALDKGQWTEAAGLAERLTALKTDEGEDYVMASHAFSRIGQMDRAIAILKELSAELKADNPQTAISLADLLMSLRRFEEAKAVADEFEKMHPNNDVVRDYFAGRQYLAQDDTEKAIATLNSVVARNPAFAPAQIHLALACVEAGRSGEARNILEAYLKRTPDDENARALLERVRKPPRTTDELLPVAAQVLDNQGSDAATLASVAASLYDVARREGRLSDAAEPLRSLLKAALAHDPKLSRAYRVLLDLTLSEGNMSEADAVIAQAEKESIGEGPLHVLRAQHALGQERVADAQSEFEADLQRSDYTTMDALAWARLFASRSMITDVGTVFAKSLPKFDEKGQQKLTAEQILLLCQIGDTDTALKALETSSIDPGYEAKVTVAQLLLQEGSEEARAKAGAILTNVRLQAPNNTQALLLDAQLKLQSTPPDMPAAQQLYEEVVKTDPVNSTALVGLGGLALGTGDYQRALEFADKVLVLSPDLLPACLLKSEALMRLDRRPEAAELLRATTILAPRSVPALEMQVNVLLDLNRKDDAQRVYARLKALPDEIQAKGPALTRLEGRMLMASGDAGQAEEALRKRLEDNPDDTDTLANLASVLDKQGRTQEAQELLTRYAEQNKDRPIGWLLLAQYYFDQGTQEGLTKASTHLTRAMLIDPDNLSALRLSIDVQIRRGSLIEAIALCDRYLAKRPDDATVLYRKAASMAELGDRPREALAVIQKALEVDSRPEYLAVRGILSARLQDYGQAIRDLQPLTQDLSKSPANVDLALAQALAATGDAKLAERYFKSAQEKAKAGQRLDPRFVEAVAQLLSNAGGKG